MTNTSSNTFEKNTSAGTRRLVFSMLLMTLSATSLHGSILALDVIPVNPNEAIFTFDTLGWSFSLSSSVTVNALGVWDAGQNGLVNSHQVGLWTNSGTLLAQTTVDNSATPVSSNDSTGGRWLFISISDVALGPGTYILGEKMGTSSSNGDPVRRLASSVTTAPQITFIEARENFSGTFDFPNISQSGNNDGFFGPNLMLTATSAPEPSAYGILIPALAAFWFALRRRADQTLCSKFHQS